MEYDEFDSTIYKNASKTYKNKDGKFHEIFHGVLETGVSDQVFRITDVAWN
jgi:hypothetical protein